MGLLWQTGILDAEKFVLKYRTVLEQSNLASLPVRLLWPKKADNSSQIGLSRDAAPPDTQVPEPGLTGFIKIDKPPEADSRPNSPAPSDISSGIQPTKSEKTDTPEMGPLKSGTEPDNGLHQIQFAGSQDIGESKEEPSDGLSPQPTHYPYSLMTGSFRTLQLVDKEISFLKKQDLAPWWTRVDLGKRGIWFRVCIGHFESAETARVFKINSNLRASRVIKTAYTNKISNFTSKEEINNKLKSLKKAGYSPYVVEDPQEGFRLLIGAYVTKEGAMQMARVLEEAGIISKVVLR